MWYKTKSLFSLHNANSVASRFVVSIGLNEKGQNIETLLSLLCISYLSVILLIQNLVVNTHFDAKEKMSRNYVGAIGPNSEPVLIYQVVAGTTASNITVVWTSSSGALVDVSSLLLDELPDVSLCV